LPSSGEQRSPADKLTRLAIQAQRERKIEETKETAAPPLLRLGLAATGGIFLLLAQTGAGWAWVGAAAYMVAISGATPGTGAACGAITATIAYFRVLGAWEGSSTFWLVLILEGGGGAIAGALGALISRRLPPYVFAFLAALVPAGLEHLGSFGYAGGLSSTALTQYRQAAVVCMARAGGLAGVTYVIFVFGGAVATWVRYVQAPAIGMISGLPPLGLVVAGLLYGAISGASTERSVNATAFNFNSHDAQYRKLTASKEYDSKRWAGYIDALFERVNRLSQEPVIESAIARGERQKTTELLVWPEAAVALDAEAKKAFFTRVEKMVQVTKCVQAIGYYDVERMESRGALTRQGSDVSDTFARQRYISGVDDVIYGSQIARRGTTTPAAVGTPIGNAAMILAIDANILGNFVAASSSGAGIICVATSGDKDARVESLRILVFNAAQCGVSVVRSATAGRLEALNPDGKILAEEEAMELTDGSVRAMVPLGSGSTLFLYVGNAFAWMALAAGIGAGLYASTRPDEGAVKGKDERAVGPLSYKTKDGMKGV